VKMTVRIRRELVDNLDGSTGAVTTVSFGLNGLSYEIDLNPRHARALRVTLQPYIDAGRCRDHPRPTRITRRTAADYEVRRWACREGIYVCDLGAIPKAVRAAFDAEQANPSSRRMPTQILPVQFRAPGHPGNIGLPAAG
jgi:nucleoid-associated protein Lsr2